MAYTLIISHSGNDWRVPVSKKQTNNKTKLRYEAFFWSSDSDFVSVIVRDFGRLGSLTFENLKHF